LELPLNFKKEKQFKDTDGMIHHCIRLYGNKQHEMDDTHRNAVIGKTILKSGW
jgi:hypothetical protein